MNEQQIRSLLSRELHAIVNSTLDTGRYAQEIAWAKDEIAQRQYFPYRIFGRVVMPVGDQS